MTPTPPVAPATSTVSPWLRVNGVDCVDGGGAGQTEHPGHRRVFFRRGSWLGRQPGW